MQRSMLVFLMLTIFAFEIPQRTRERTIFDRIVYIYNLKSLIDKKFWNGFSKEQFDLPLIYYSDSVCYVGNPTDRFISSFKPNLVFEEGNLKIYKTHLLDSIPFHMETSMTFGSGSTAYNHHSPFMNCSSLEITRRNVPGVNSTEQWATMILHEYFHGFQFKHPDFTNTFEKHATLVSEDSLKRIYKAENWFKESADKENQMLLAALKETDDQQRNKLLHSFYQLREERRTQAKLKLNLDIKTIEQTYETMEGTARYVEYFLYTNFALKEPNEKLIKSDSSYHGYQDFRNYHLEKDPWLYVSEKTTYFYATGFNIVRLLEKLKINYKGDLFNNGNLSLEEVLYQVLEKER